MQAALTALPRQHIVASPQGAARDTTDRAAVDSTALLQGNKAVTIVHNGSLYRLQATKLGKLILTK
ncbi:Hemin uptake protein hemP [Oryzisolibacter propanilivorax]|uniref:Hemin uptake protein hemP n=1 Tax=Oryzisolibacter propanilivorax TaxID=1527607 RepID=A0A1G9U8U7_9BURK|nr:hemin uptake protein HemP [Oryzisolibacter propanilivorax]SDM56417.1 Hemin uptake protein hemP [Oryzisolibacter propanilivorax]